MTPTARLSRRDLSIALACLLLPGALAAPGAKASEPMRIKVVDGWVLLDSDLLPPS